MHQSHPALPGNGNLHQTIEEPIYLSPYLSQTPHHPYLSQNHLTHLAVEVEALVYPKVSPEKVYPP